MEMRVPEHVLHLLFSSVLKEGFSDAKARLAAAEQLLQKQPHCEWWKLTYDEKTKNLVRTAIGRADAKKILPHMPTTVVPALLRPHEPHFDDWLAVFEHYSDLTTKLRHKPSLADGFVNLGDDGYDLQLAQHADSIQLSADKFVNAFEKIVGDKALTSYIFDLKAGFYRHDMLTTKLYPAFTSNDGNEYSNEVSRRRGA